MSLIMRWPKIAHCFYHKTARENQVAIIEALKVDPTRFDWIGLDLFSIWCGKEYAIYRFKKGVITGHLHGYFDDAGLGHPEPFLEIE